MKVLEQLIKARQLITPLENFGIGKFIQKNDSGGFAYCARGALFQVKKKGIVTANACAMSTDDREACKELFKGIPVVYQIYSDTDSVAVYNNEHGHTATLALFDATIARLKREQIVADLLTKDAVNMVQDQLEPVT